MRQFALALALVVAACVQNRDPRIVPLRLTPLPGRDAVQRAKLPAQLPAGAHLVFRAYTGRIEIFAGAQNIYDFEDSAARGHLRTHDVTLPPQVAGTWLVIRFPGEGAPFIGGTPLLVPAAAVPEAIVEITTEPLRSDLEHPGVGAVLAIIGLACIAVSLVRASGNTSALLWFGAFALLYGLRLIAASGLPLVLGASYQAARYSAAFITYVIPIPGWQMARKILGDAWKGSLKWQVVAFAVFAPIGIISDLVQGQPGSLSTINNVLIVIGGINVFLNVATAARRGERELWAVITGSLFFLFVALNNNLADLGVLPWRPLDETLGFLVFTASLGYAAVRAFARGERQRLSIEGELTAAREIQRSILPRSMPAVRGLKFEVRYDPASSVAGDFYDFVSDGDAGVGLLVADVAGHGVPAALIASMVKIAVSSQSHLARDPAAMLAGLNETLRREVRREFVTATYLHFDAASRHVDVSNAGHPSPLLLRNGEFRELGTSGVLLGRFGKVHYETQRTMIAAGDRIVVWTDGIVEARNSREEAFGEQRLRAIVKDGGSTDAVIDAVHRWRGRADSDDADDLTIVIADVTG